MKETKHPSNSNDLSFPSTFTLTSTLTLMSCNFNPRSASEDIYGQLVTSSLHVGNFKLSSLPDRK